MCVFLAGKLEHISHEHPLVTCIIVSGNSLCKGCGKSIHGSCYGCKTCHDSFFLHKSCVKVSDKVQHPLHDKHPLIFHKTPPYDAGICTCKICREPCKWFVYHCPLCKFDAHVKCLSLSLSINTEIHNHQLTLFGKFITFICDFCGKEGKSMPYLCAGSSCGFWAHHNCAALPRMVKHIRHKHRLNLTNSIKDNYSEHQICRLCVKNVDINYGVYYCSKCDYVAHIHCATDEEGIDENYEDSMPDEFTNELCYTIKKTKVGEDKIEIPIEIKHFYHPHDLKLSVELENYEICNGCIQPIFSPFYRCTQCNFLLHKSCAELPHKKQHPFHQHHLTLKLRNRNPTLCDACRCKCNGFMYNCVKCSIDLDVSCTLISEPNMLTHIGHKHPLIFSSTTNDEECSVCNSTGRMFRCTKCEFTLDFRCATLPLTIKSKLHEHPFTLYCTVEDDSDEYYCDICEEERDPKYWFYYCEKCSYPAHPKCIFGGFLNTYFGDYRNIKFGTTYISTVHQHPLTLVQRTMEMPCCDKCGQLAGNEIGQPNNEITYLCATCNFSFHPWCV